MNCFPFCSVKLLKLLINLQYGKVKECEGYFF